jgi:peptidoglycan hydrolase-like protein with peptidoglycan-binding domain
LGNLNGAGTFGEKTEATVRAFQATNVLKAYGIAGPLTLDRVDQLRYSIISGKASLVDPGLRGSVIGGLLAIAQAEVRVHEVGGDNRGVRVQDCQCATELRSLVDWPWCAAFISWVIRE